MNFSQVPDRSNTRSVKWDLGKKIYKSEDILPMWVADMDFMAPTQVIEDLKKRLEHGVFGYTITDKEIETSIQGWFSDHYHWDISTDWITYSPGVVPSLHMIVESLTNEKDRIMIQPPVYPPFFDVVEKHNRTLVENPLVLEDGRYEMDYDHIEEEFKKGVSLFILCNPHNPVGRVWTYDELNKLGQLCLQYNVFIVSDEIHADIIYRSHQHVPIASLSKDLANITISCYAPTKTFNLAGLQVSYLVTPNSEIRTKVKNFFGKFGLGMLNTMGITGMESAYLKGEKWLEELILIIEENKKIVEDMIQPYNEFVKLIQSEGTYLLWLDFRGLQMDDEELKLFLQEKAKVGFNNGKSFGVNGEGFMRMNIATTTENVKEGTRRILKALDKYVAKE
ncbi:MalY/PatB family protein [Bacillaceae bacterium S4-13-56]